MKYSKYFEVFNMKPKSDYYDIRKLLKNVKREKMKSRDEKDKITNKSIPVNSETQTDKPYNCYKNYKTNR